MKLSILFTVYNQSEILKEQLSQLKQYPGNDIEVVISDDCSTQDIEGLVAQFNDKRIKYYCNKENVGHDLNIICGLRHCTSDFIYLFRTKDTVLTENLSGIKNLIQRNPNAVYFFLSAVDENGNPRLKFRDRVYYKGKETCEAHFKLPVHPSGSIYKKKYLNLDLYERYIRDGFDHKYGFVAHQLIRLDLSQKGDFVVSKIYGWKYFRTLQGGDIAVNSDPTGINVYAPKYAIQSYLCQLKFELGALNQDIRFLYILSQIRFSYIHIGYKCIAVCKDYRYALHYNARIEYYDVHDVVREMNRVTDSVCRMLPDKGRKRIKLEQRRLEILLLTWYQVKKRLREAIIGNANLYEGAIKLLRMMRK